jgi:hypothetical protein
MSKIYLVMERFYEYNDECYALQNGVCGRPERVFTNRQEAEAYCNHLNQITIAICLPHLFYSDGVGWDEDESVPVMGFVRLEEREEKKLDVLPEERDRFFMTSAYDAYVITELEIEDASILNQALSFNQIDAPTYQQCHEVAHLFSIPSALEVGFPLYRTIQPEEREIMQYQTDYWEEWEEEDTESEEYDKWQHEQEVKMYRHLPQPPFAWSNFKKSTEYPDVEHLFTRVHDSTIIEYYEQHLKWTSNEEEEWTSNEEEIH